METPNPNQKIQKKINALKPNWALWFFPIIALILTGWLFYSIYQQRGTEINLTLDDAAGLQADKTQIRYRGVAIGHIKSITISEDTNNVHALVQLEKEANLFAVEGSKFWVVSPKVSLQGVTGLETILEGTYIAALPGSPNNAKKTDFKISSSSVSDESLENTSVFFLETPNAESVSEGDAVTFRGLNVGSISKVTLSKTGQLVQVQLNINNRYVRLIRTNTVFWRKVGVHAKLGLFNSEVTINSIDSIMRGGVEFFTPQEAGPRAKGGARFTLNAAPPKDYQKWNPVLE